MNTEDIKGRLKYNFTYRMALVITHPYLYIDDKEKLKSLGIDDKRYEKLNTYNDELTEEEISLFGNLLNKEINDDTSSVDIISDFISPGRFELKAKKFFCEINDPTKAEYWSSQKLEYDKAANKEVNNYLTKDSTTFEDVIEFAIKRALKYLSCNPKNSYWDKDPYSLHGTSGNSKYTQFDCSLSNFTRVVIQKLYQKYEIPPEGSYERDLGFGHFAKRYIEDDYLYIGTKGDKFYIEYKPKVKGDKGFHDELIDNLSSVKKDLRKFCESSKYFKQTIPELLKEIE
jgi:hypothetical protein